MERHDIKLNGKMIKYIAEEWPEYQIFMEHPLFREKCYFCQDANLYFIPEDLYNEVISNLEKE